MSPYTIPSATRKRITWLLDQLYGQPARQDFMPRLVDLLSIKQSRLIPPPTAGPLTEKDCFLITYPDMVISKDVLPLRGLNTFLVKWLGGLIGGIHILPFFPSSSDDGFSVIDYRAVNPAFGDWQDIEQLSPHFRLMADAVINHISRESQWFQTYLAGEQPYLDYFLEVDPSSDLSEVVRPRDLPLLTPVSTSRGRKHLWTTFSADQIDLNYGNPQVLLEILAILLEYIQHGIQVLRLDAVAFLWKEPGTSSIHLPQTHYIIQFFRAVLEMVAPWVILITETNVPHEENISYFGDGTNESHLVYQFPLPPLVLHTLHSGDTEPLVTWIRELHLPSPEVTFFNFLASHDGIGMRPAQDLLSEAAREELIGLTKASGGDITYRKIGRADRQPYELNITYLNALSKPGELDREPAMAIRRFLCAHSLLFSLQGVPAIYFHSLFGSQNDVEGVVTSGQLRSINRQKLSLKQLVADLEKPDSIRSQIFQGMSTMLNRRRQLSSFHPLSQQQVLDLPTGLIGIRRLPYDGAPPITTVHNASNRPLEVKLPGSNEGRWFDILLGDSLPSGPISLQPWGYRWLQETQPEAPNV